MSEFSWSDRPSEKHKGRAIFGYVVIALTAIAVYIGDDDNLILSIFSIFLMILATSRFYFTSHYYADEIGVGEKFFGNSRARKWKEFKRVDVGKSAVFLSPFEKPRRMDSFRVLFIPIPNDEIKRFILEKVKSANAQNAEQAAEEIK